MGKLNLVFWNIEGFYKNIFNFDSDAIKFITNYEIICFTETFIVKDTVNVPDWLSNYTYFSSKASKFNVRGRPSGGLIIFVKNNIFKNVSKLFSDRFSIFIKIEIDFDTLVIGNVYWRPDDDTEICIQSLENTLLNINVDNLDGVILGGDWNARFGELNQFSSETFEGSNIFADRISLDLFTNTRGRKLINFMEENGFFVLNGRTVGDFPGQFTDVTARGASVVDTVWISFSMIDYVYNLKVISMPEFSSHLPVTLSLYNFNRLTYETTNNNDNVFTKIYLDLNDNTKESFSFLLSESENIYFNSDNVNQLYENFLFAFNTCAFQSGLLKTKRCNSVPTNIKNKIWYNKDCKEAKKFVRNNYFNLKKSNFSEDNYSRFNQSKKDYKELIKKTKKAYYSQTLEIISNTSNAKSFWEVINKLRPKNNAKNTIPLEDFAIYYRDFYSSRVLCEDTYFGNSVPTLDDEIDLSELQAVIKNCKNGKAAGTDHLSYEFFKLMPANWEHYLLNLYNCALNNSYIPDKWAEISFFHIFKKGDRNDPSCYRSIALINCVLKIFTAILTKRIIAWAEENGKLPEEQNGFRPGRGCSDNVFILLSIIALGMKQKKGTVYAAFIDFRRAFDLLIHSKLWAKLFALGLSAKLINILKHLYDKAEIILKDTNCEWRVDVSKGVLQGDSLSPLLFSLYISDLITFIESGSPYGVSINNDKEIVGLLYADDLLLVDLTCFGMNKKLRLLSQYCEVNSLEVNINKTKVVPFKRGRIKSNSNFYYNNQKLDVCSTFTYLGVFFSRSGVFSRAADDFVRKAQLASSKAREILIRSRSDAWSTKARLFNSLVSSTLLYLSETWAAMYTDKLEKVQQTYYKSIYQWPRHTPGYMVRLETGTRHIETEILKRMLRSWIRIHEMEPHRLPRLCLNKLINLDSSAGNNIKYNWVTQLKNKLNALGASNFVCISSVHLMKKELKNVLEKCNNHYLSKDINFTFNSSLNTFYRRISNLNCREIYLDERVNVNKHRIVSQLRLCRHNCFRIIYKGKLFYFDEESLCNYCNLNQPNNLSHFLLHCSIIQNYRFKFIHKYLKRDVNDLDNLEILLTITNVDHLNDLYYFTISSLKFFDLINAVSE